MQQLKIILSRLKNPSVVLSIVSQIITVLALLKIDDNISIVTKIVIGVCSVFVLLGIISNPSSKKFGYGDDILNCQNCNKDTLHTFIYNNFVCVECGHKFEKDKK